MQFSIWDYLKERARKATLAGVAEALDELEGENSEASHEAAADRLRARLSGQAVSPVLEPAHVTTDQPAATVPMPTGTVPSHEGSRTNGRAPTPPVQLESPSSPRPVATPTTRPTQDKKPDPFEERLNGPLPKAASGVSTAPVAPQERRGPSRNGHPVPDPEFTAPPPRPEPPERRKRGRPRKD